MFHSQIETVLAALAFWLLDITCFAGSAQIFLDSQMINKSYQNSKKKQQQKN